MPKERGSETLLNWFCVCQRARAKGINGINGLNGLNGLKGLKGLKGIKDLKGLVNFFNSTFTYLGLRHLLLNHLKKQSVGTQSIQWRKIKYFHKCGHIKLKKNL